MLVIEMKIEFNSLLILLSYIIADKLADFLENIELKVNEILYISTLWWIYILAHVRL